MLKFVVKFMMLKIAVKIMLINFTIVEVIFKVIKRIINVMVMAMRRIMVVITI